MFGNYEKIILLVVSLLSPLLILWFIYLKNTVENFCELRTLNNLSWSNSITVALRKPLEDFKKSMARPLGPIGGFQILVAVGIYFLMLLSFSLLPILQLPLNLESTFIPFVSTSGETLLIFMAMIGAIIVLMILNEWSSGYSIYIMSANKKIFYAASDLIVLLLGSLILILTYESANLLEIVDIQLSLWGIFLQPVVFLLLGLIALDFCDKPLDENFKKQFGPEENILDKFFRNFLSVLVSLFIIISLLGGASPGIGLFFDPAFHFVATLISFLVVSIKLVLFYYLISMVNFVLPQRDVLSVSESTITWTLPVLSLNLIITLWLKNGWWI